MDYNLSFYEILGRYALMMAFVILGGVLHMLPLMVVGLPFFITGLIGWCPVYAICGINHAVKTDSDEG